MNARLAAPFAVLAVGFLAAVTILQIRDDATAGIASCSSTLSPGANVEAAVNSASAGATICLSAGTYTSPTWREHGGVQGNPVTLRSKEPQNPALLSGRFVTSGTASWITIRDLKFIWSTAGNSNSLDDAVVLGTPHITFVHNDVSGAGGHICVNGVEYNGHRVESSLIDHNTIHNCQGDELHEQGIYMLGGPGNVISSNWVWAVAARCYQIRGEKGGRWEHNVCAESREGLIFGDLTPSANIVEHNIVATVKDNSAYTYGSVGSGNVFANNCISKAFGNNSGVTVTGNTVAQAVFVNAAAHDYTLTAASPCQGAGVLGEKPGPGTEGNVEPAPQPAEELKPPRTPTGLVLVSHGTSIGVSFTANPEADKVSAYNLYRAGRNYPGHPAGSPWATTATLGFTQAYEVEPRLRLCYQLTAVNARGESPRTADVCVTA
jgi:putative hemolysin